MKKFYAFAAAAFMAFAANAESLYIVGAGQGIAWNPGEPAEFKLVDGNYVFECKGLSEFKISTVMGTWGEFNAGALYCKYGKEDLGKAVELVSGDGNIATPWEGDYTITVAGDLSTLTLVTTTEEPTGPIEIYLRGGMNNWGDENKEEGIPAAEYLAPWKFTQTEGTEDVYEFTCAPDQVIEAGTDFKIGTANWSKINLGLGEGDEVSMDSECVLLNDGGSGNIQLEEEFDGVVFVNVVVGEDSALVFFSNDKETENPFIGEGAISSVSIENGVAVYYNINGVRVNAPENGIFIVVKNGKAAKVIK